MKRSPVQCPVWVDHRSVDLARQRTVSMSTSDLYDWTTNVAYDVAALVDRCRDGDPTAADMLGTADAMLHACVIEVTARTKRKT